MVEDLFEVVAGAGAAQQRAWRRERRRGEQVLGLRPRHLLLADEGGVEARQQRRRALFPERHDGHLRRLIGEAALERVGAGGGGGAHRRRGAGCY